MTRRELLRALGLSAGATVLGGAAGCSHGSAGAGAGGGARVDDSFARLVFQYLQNQSAALQRDLLDHPALAAIQRHAKFSGGAKSSGEALVEGMVATTLKDRPGTAVLDAWEGRWDDLLAWTRVALEYLPAGAQPVRTIYLVSGFDIGLAAPPDIVLNVTHPHFQAAPGELAFYAIHEAHHVGFFDFRPPTEPFALEWPQHLLEFVRYWTQGEGMAVHAAFASRLRRGAVEGDEDYRVYGDAGARASAVTRYRSLLAQLPSRGLVDHGAVETLVSAMSLGERLWYRFGALVARELEEKHGRKALAASVTQPDLFVAAAERLLKGA